MGFKTQSRLVLFRTGFILFILSVLFLAVHRSGDATLKVTHPLASSDLRCADTIQIFNWSRSRYGGKLTTQIDSPAFQDSVFSTLIEKLDAYHILFTQDEVELLQREGKKHWNALVSKKKCDFADAWIESHWSAAVDRLWKTLATAQLPKDYSTKYTSNDENAEVEKRWTTVAKDEEQLKARVAQLLSEIAAHSQRGLVKAYGEDKRQFFVDRVQELFFDGPVRSHTLLAKALLGAMDPFSTYFPGDEFEEFYNELSGGTSGIGVQVRKVPTGYFVEKVISESAAGKSQQVRKGDVIASIDGVVLKDMAKRVAKNLFSGPADSKVTLGILRDGTKKSVTLTRSPFAFDEGRITTRILKSDDGEVALIDIPSFYGRAGMHAEREERSSAEDLKAELQKLAKRKSPIRAVVLDVRGNPGGYLEEAVTMAGYFIGQRPVVSVVENAGTRVMKEEGATPLYKGALVVLSDTGTASASEVLAGALKDYHRALVVGTPRTFGKGSVQKLFHLDDEFMGTGLDAEQGKGVVKLTTSFFYSPMGHSPNNGGVIPHIALNAKSPSAKPAKRLVTVPETAPTLDDTSLAALKNQDRLFLLRVKDLESRREERQKMRSELLKDESDPAIPETIQLAIDHAQLELRDRQAFSSAAE